MNAGERIKKYRKAQGLTQAELAEKSGVSRESIINYENGRRKSIAIDNAQKIAAALGIPLGALFGGPLTHETIVTNSIDGTKYPKESIITVTNELMEQIKQRKMEGDKRAEAAFSALAAAFNDENMSKEILTLAAETLVSFLQSEKEKMTKPSDDKKE